MAKDHAIGLYLTGIRDGGPVAALDAHIGARHVRHSTGVPDGRDGVIAFFEDFIKRNRDRRIEVVRALQDGGKVFLHVHQALNGGEAQWATADVFDTDDDGRMIEHRDVSEPVPPASELANSGKF